MKRNRGYGLRGAWQALLLASCLVAMPGRAATQLTYPLTSDGIDSRYDYDWAVLRTALEKTTPQYGVFEQHQSTVAMSPPRVVQEMSSLSGRINIFVRATTPELERQFLPVRLPVDRGLLGYRLLLIRGANQQRFAAVKNVADLRHLRAGLGQGWADIPIFQRAGVPVVEGSSYDGLFAMLEAERFDFYSRSADEAMREFQERHDAHPQMAVEQTLLLHYPLPRYFFVRRDAEGQAAGKAHRNRHGDNDQGRIVERAVPALQGRLDQEHGHAQAPRHQPRQSQADATDAAGTRRAVVQSPHRQISRFKAR